MFLDRKVNFNDNSQESFGWDRKIRRKKIREMDILTAFLAHSKMFSITLEDASSPKKLKHNFHY